MLYLCLCSCGWWPDLRRDRFTLRFRDNCSSSIWIFGAMSPRIVFIVRCPIDFATILGVDMRLQSGVLGG
jgi:hypothetical protein